MDRSRARPWRRHEGLTKTDARIDPDDDIELLPATLADVDDVLALVGACVEDMTGRGILQWDELYPDRETVEDDVRIGAALLARHCGEAVAYFALDSAQDEQYAQVAWSIAAGPVAVVHRLMVAPALQGRGLGRWCMAVAERTAAARGFATMRLEAFAGNPGTVRFYERCGYRAAGVIRFRTGEFTCFEKALIGREG